MVLCCNEYFSETFFYIYHLPRLLLSTLYVLKSIHPLAFHLARSSTSDSFLTVVIVSFRYIDHHQLTKVLQLELLLQIQVVYLLLLLWKSIALSRI